MEKLKEIVTKYPRIGIAGLPGCGKTYASAVLANLIEKKVYIFDTTGAFTSKRLFKGIYIEIPKNYEKEFKNVLEKTLKSQQRFIIFNLKNVVLNLHCEILDQFAKWLNSKGQVNVAVLIDEVGNYMRQGKGYYSWEFDMTVRTKRNDGIDPILLITQRPATVDKDIYALCSAHIFFQLSHTLDKKAIQGILGLSNNEFRPIEEQLATLGKQECLIYRDGTTEKFTFPTLVVR